MSMKLIVGQNVLKLVKYGGDEGGEGITNKWMCWIRSGLQKGRVSWASILFCVEGSRNLNEGCGKEVKINRLFRQKQVKLDMRSCKQYCGAKWFETLLRARRKCFMICFLELLLIYLLTYLLTPRCRVLLEQLTSLQLVKKYPAFHGTRMFITTLTSVRHLSLSWASPIQSIYPHPTSWSSILILSTHLRLGLPNTYHQIYSYLLHGAESFLSS